MRLTLRGLLAYLDKILEPSAMQAMAAKLEESPAAAELVHRIRDVTKKVRLAAPSVEGKGMGLDANTVAEYLDNTLPGDRTPDFEMVCLESDVHLAEVAACHEVLSLVLVKPAEIDPASRRRMYDLINVATKHPPAAHPAGAQAAAAAVPVATPIATPVAEESKRRREVPEYLRGPEATAAKAKSGLLMAAIAIAALLLVGGTAALVIVPLRSLPESLHPVARIFHPGAEVAANDPAPIAASPIDGPRRTTGDRPTVPTTTRSDDAGAELRQPASAVGSPGPDATTGSSAAGSTVIVDSTTPTIQPAGTPVPPSTASSTAATELRQPESAVAAAAVTTPAAGDALPLPPSPVPPSPVPPAPAPPPSPSSTDSTAAAVSAVPVPDTTVLPPMATKIEPVGRVSSAATEVLLRFDAGQNTWVRLPVREQLMVGDRLLAMPDFRPQIALANGLTIEILGGTLIELTSLDGANTPGILLMRGRLLLFTVGGAQAALRVDNGQQPSTFVLSTAELGMEYVPRRMPGADPTQENPWSISLYAKSGQAAWSSGVGPSTMLTVPGTSMFTTVDPPTAVPTAAALPAWLENDERDATRKEAADALQRKLSEDPTKALSVALREMLLPRATGSPPPAENVRLALRCLAQIGEYSDFPSLLRDATLRYAEHDRYIGTLAQAVDFGPLYAAKLRDDFVAKRGPEGNDLYRMLWGYDDEQLRSGAAQFLVESLDHAELDFRLLAYWSLAETTGMTLSYVPTDAQLKRRPAVMKWQQKLQEGQIVRKPLP